VSAPLFLVDDLPAGPSCTLTGPEGHHAATVQRLRAGEALILADGRGGVATAEVVAVGKGTVEVRVTAREHVAAADPRLVVAQGIAKGDRGELAVQAMTEIGVDEILPWAASRSVAQWRGERGAKSREKWAATAREAAKQARRAWLPVVGGDPDCSTKQIAARLASAARAFVLHEEATVRLASSFVAAMWFTATEQPSRANARLVARPNPVAPPVISATLPATFRRHLPRSRGKAV